MERLNVRTLILELTRECNLECMHCFRGDSESVFMNPDLLNKIFKNLARVNTLLLTGGEPFLAINQLERLRDIIMTDRTNIHEIVIVTNGTILDENILNLLVDISTRANLEIRVSSDKFHEIELERRNLTKIKDKNIKVLKSQFNVDEELPNEKVYVVDRVGRATDLTEDDLNKINNMKGNKVKYIFATNRRLDEYRNSYPLPRLLKEDNVVDGNLNLDVYGNITPTYYPFAAEDKNRYSNIRGNKTLKKAITNVKS